MPPKKKLKQHEQQSFFGGSRQDILRSLNSTHVGKRILLRAKDLYNGNIPKGEENVLHQYSILSINADLVSAVIAYDQKCITEGMDKFRDYPLSNDDEGEIDDYKITNLNEDHELYNVHLGRVNKRINDLKEIQRERQEEKKVAAIDDVSDIQRKLSDGDDPYLILLGEFMCSGPLSDHIIQKGKDKGKTTKKQSWQHIHSGHKFVWHYSVAQNVFARDKPWKVAREIMKKSMKGYRRIAAIMKAARMPVTNGTDLDGNSLLSRDIDTVLRVTAVKACVGAKFPLAVSENIFFRDYVKQLNPGHRPPYRLERIRILECMIDYAKQELGWIMDERRQELVKNFMSGTIDFWTDPHRKQQFGCFVVDLTAEKYQMQNGLSLFMSRRTKNRLNDNLFSNATPVLDSLEYPMNFEAFDHAKTIVNVTDWMLDSCKESTIQQDDWGQLAADGGSNAIGSIREFELVTRLEDGGRESSLDFKICYSHQNERSGGYASGTVKFADSQNDLLGDILKKSHSIQVRFNRSNNRMTVFNEMQHDKGRSPLLSPDPAGETRWNGFIDETTRANQIMGDLCDANDILLSPKGYDANLVTEEERVDGDLSRHTYTQHDKMVLRQFEGASAPAKYLCLFLQDKRNTWSYVLFTLRMTIKETTSNTFTIVDDVSHSDLTVDLRKRGEKTVLVKKASSTVSAQIEKKFKIEVMDPMIEKYRMLYANDLAKRVGLNGTLPNALTFSVLLNPLFGLQQRIVGSGLLTEVQFTNAKRGLIQAMQDLLDRKHPPTCANADDDESEEEDDGYEHRNTNSNFNVATEEFNRFESYKRNKFRPKKWKTAALTVLSAFDMNSEKIQEIIVAPVEEKGKDLPSGKNMGDYVDSKGRMDVLKFFQDHKKHFPNLWIIVQREAARRTVEVGCERFFGLSGYVSGPRQTNLGVRTYERLAMLTSIVQNVFIDDNWVATEYLERCKTGKWTKKNDEDALKCWNLERIIDAEEKGTEKPQPMTLNDLLGEGEEEEESDEVEKILL